MPQILQDSRLEISNFLVPHGGVHPSSWKHLQTDWIQGFRTFVGNVSPAPPHHIWNICYCCCWGSLSYLDCENRIILFCLRQIAADGCREGAAARTVIIALFWSVSYSGSHKYHRIVPLVVRNIGGGAPLLLRLTQPVLTSRHRRRGGGADWYWVSLIYDSPANFSWAAPSARAVLSVQVCDKCQEGYKQYLSCRYWTGAASTSCNKLTQRKANILAQSKNQVK